MNASRPSNIRLAYDITALGAYFSWPDSKTGIYRVAEEILNQIISSPNNIETTLVGLCGEAIAFTSIGSQKYLEEREAENGRFEGVKFRSTYRSRLRLEWLYSKVYERYFSKRFQGKNKRSMESFLVRGILKTLDVSRFAKLDTFKIFYPEEFDVFHSTYYKLPSKDLTGNLPRLITLYDLIPLTAKEFVDPKLNSYFLSILESIDPESDWVACISEYTRTEFCEHTDFPKERTLVTALAADSSFRPVGDDHQVSQAKKQYRIPDSDYFLCLASHLDPRKNIFHLIKSFVKLISENASLDTNLVLIGSLRFDREEVSNALLEFNEFKDRIIFTGYVPDEDLCAIYNGATAFVFPSLYEGFGLPILEAMQSGTPVISSNSTSLPEVAGDAAILVDPRNEDELCQAMLDVLKDESLRKQMIKRGLARAELFSWERCAQETIEIYRKIVAIHG
jgi:glycosyltransferase involved in cell wall biosynthesis